jgi:hypothetical protein
MPPSFRIGRLKAMRSDFVAILAEAATPVNRSRAFRIAEVKRSRLQRAGRPFRANVLSSSGWMIRSFIRG